MVNVKEVPPELLMKQLAEEFKKKNLEVPEWTDYLKAGIHREKSWNDPDWFYTRLASTLRKVYVKGPIGISRLSEDYGGRVDRGSQRYHPGKGSRYIVRQMLQTLEKLGYVKKDKKGRSISPEGASILDKASKEAMKALAQSDPSLEKYL
ncbi:MAG: 30S ribosomal protein S19e [Candidatus Thermoplasmatota archaeon]|jgi:small subunit ribosomal protein S19e|nr:30S ribosomal protein S19e [Candidatus Thermoplasmatota archaeon]MCL5954698.1 30S ribosomal protein S19e [Candidatus Thermoplasmatota archaeon]